MTLRPLLGPGWLALVLAPVLVLAVVQAVRAHAGPLPGGPSGPGRWWLRALGVLAVAGLGLAPSVPVETDEELAVAVDVFFVVDRTGSMAAEDWEGGAPRLDGVRHDVRALVDAIPGARYSVLAWDSEATRQLPLTVDENAVDAWAATLRQEITAYSSGSLVDRPLDALARALEGAAEKNPSHVRLVFFLSDGEQTTEGEPRSYAAVAPLVDGGAVLGYGTAEGAPMRSYDGSVDLDPEAPYITDPSQPAGADGEAPPAISRIDEARLAAIADQLGVPYVHRTGPTEVASLVADLDPEEIAADGRRAESVWRAVSWPFALVLLAVLGAEVWWGVRGWTPLGLRRLGIGGRT